jgi:plasmid stabilization system protein ParE
LTQARLEFQKAADDYDNAGAANDFERRITAAVGQLQVFPEGGRTGRVHGTREVVILKHPYIVVYRVRGDELEVLGIRHTSRQWPEP